ncbi:hypothetical protein L7F22_029240 [Adiantum nelumboides]|nr:hypothetical protein [Adiantum nelumboides]
MEKQAILEPRKGEPKKQQQEEDEENIENIQANPIPPSPKSLAPRSPPPPASPPPPQSTLAPSLLPKEAPSNEDVPPQPPSQALAVEEVPKQGKTSKETEAEAVALEQQEQGTKGVLEPHPPVPPQEMVQIHLPMGEILEPRALSPSSTRRVPVATLIIQTDPSQEEAYEVTIQVLILKNKQFHDDIVASDFDMAVRLVIVYGRLKIGSVRNAFEESIGNKIEKFSAKEDGPLLESFISLFKDDIKLPKGTTIDVRRQAGHILTTTKFKVF